jgi:hypothetical protein
VFEEEFIIISLFRNIEDKWPPNAVKILVYFCHAKYVKAKLSGARYAE